MFFLNLRRKLVSLQKKIAERKQVSRKTGKEPEKIGNFIRAVQEKARLEALHSSVSENNIETSQEEAETLTTFLKKTVNEIAGQPDSFRKLAALNRNLSEKRDEYYKSTLPEEIKKIFMMVDERIKKSLSDSGYTDITAHNDGNKKHVTGMNDDGDFITATYTDAFDLQLHIDDFDGTRPPAEVDAELKKFKSALDKNGVVIPCLTKEFNNQKIVKGRESDKVDTLWKTLKTIGNTETERN